GGHAHQGDRLVGARGRVSRLLIEDAELSKEGPAREGSQDDLLALGGDDDVHLPFFDDVEPLGGVTLPENRRAGVELHPLARRDKRFALLFGQVSKQVNAFEGMALGHETSCFSCGAYCAEGAAASRARALRRTDGMIDASSRSRVETPNAG